MATVELKKVVKRYGKTEVVHGVDIDVNDREFVVFVGPSGCGKSTILRMIAGLEEISDGELYIDGDKVNALPPSKRGIAMVFQTYALYPHMTVRDNMAFGLKLEGRPKAEVNERVDRAAGILQIENLLDRKPKDMSGGQRQRVAIGRSIVRDPKVFLFDEPLSNLDAKLRVQMRLEIAKLHRELNATMIYVTHDQVEAMTMADKIVVLSAGHVEQIGAPLQLYHKPENRFVAGFIGSPAMNFAPLPNAAVQGEMAEVTLADGVTLSVPVKAGSAAPTELGVRPEHLDVLLGDAKAPKGAVTIDAQVIATEALGGTTFVYADSPLGQLTIETRGHMAVNAGNTVALAISPDHVHLFDANGKAIGFGTALPE